MQLGKLCKKEMKTFNIYPLGKDYPILVKGNYSAYMRSLEKGEFKTFYFETVENPYKKLIIRASNDRSSNEGQWFAHCNGYNMNIVLNKSGLISINTYADYRKICIEKKKSYQYGY